MVGHILRQSPSWLEHIDPQENSIRLGRGRPSPDELGEVLKTPHTGGGRA